MPSNSKVTNYSQQLFTTIRVVHPYAKLAYMIGVKAIDREIVNRFDSFRFPNGSHKRFATVRKPHLIARL